MTITNPGAISNSGSKKFTAQIAQSAKINYNKNLNNEEYNAYITAVWYQNYSGSNTAGNSIPNNTFGNLQVSRGAPSNPSNNRKNKKDKKDKKDKKCKRC